MVQLAALFLSCLACAIAWQLFRWIDQASRQLEEQRVRSYSFSYKAGQAEAENDRLAGQLAQLTAELEAVAQKRHTQATTEGIENCTGAVLGVLDGLNYANFLARQALEDLRFIRPGPNAYREKPKNTDNRPARPGAAAVKPWHL